MNDSCSNSTHLHRDGSPVLSAVMFGAGVAGNAMALAILGVHRQSLRAKSSAFAVLATGLAATDLLGTCFLSPAVFAAYARNSSLLGLTRGPGLCQGFAFAMTFFGLASTLLLFAMAVERYLALSRPYLYAQHDPRRWARLALPAAYTFCAAFCSLPFAGVGRHMQYCPGSWCFIQMETPDDAAARAFSLAYAGLVTLLVGATFLCNGSVTVSLCRMYRQQRRRWGSLGPGRARRKSWFGASWGEAEVDHLVLLVAMTGIFAVCSLPLAIRGFIGSLAPGESRSLKKDLIAFRFSAFNPIVDPWVFILFRKTVFRRLRQLLCCARAPPPTPKTPDLAFQSRAQGSDPLRAAGKADEAAPHPRG
ncbi:prostacyclin receptor [Ornithorhynchus anatinus]|uniref:prostacyclin receptor n=1 Tax=Ornithorhynchus anatinus TaxID=9258 RepID=UPI0010A7DA55|nr:prostacyclin receptor [Ornithorhynchus anatinus]